MQKVRLTAVVGILLIIASVVGFIGFGMGDGDAFVKIVKLVMAGVMAALGVAVATGEGD